MYGSNCGRMEPVKTAPEKLKTQYEKAFKEPWDESSTDKIKELKHVSISYAYDSFYVSLSAQGSEKILLVDDEVLGFLYKELAVRFDALCISAAIVEGIGGKDILATTIVVNAGIEGLSELTFDYRPDNEEQRERCLAEAATIIRRSASTLRKLGCTTDGVEYVKRLSPETALELLVVNVSDYRRTTRWTLDDIVTILRANAAEIRIDIKATSTFEKAEYTAHEALACRKLTLVHNNADIHVDRHPTLAKLLKCVNAVCMHLDSLDFVLDDHFDVDAGHLRDPFPDMLDGQVQAYKKLMSTVPFNFPTKFYVNYSVNYEYADVKYRKWNTRFIKHFKKMYKNVTEKEGKPRHGWMQDYELRSHEDLGEGRALHVAVNVQVSPNPDRHEYDAYDDYD